MQPVQAYHRPSLALQGAMNNPPGRLPRHGWHTGSTSMADSNYLDFLHPVSGSSCPWNCQTNPNCSLAIEASKTNGFIRIKVERRATFG